MHIEDLPRAPVLALRHGELLNKMTLFDKQAVNVVRVRPTETVILWSSYLPQECIAGNSELEEACRTPF
jgi:hypothetical protein